MKARTRTAPLRALLGVTAVLMACCASLQAALAIYEPFAGNRRKHRSLATLLSLGALALFALPGSSRADTLTTDGFETDYGNWTAQGNAVRSTTSPNTGTYSVRVDRSSSSALLLTQPLPLDSRGYASVTLSFSYVWSVTSGSYYIMMEYSPDGGVTWTYIESVYATTTRTLYSKTLARPAFTDKFLFRIRGATGTPTTYYCYIDDVTITATPDIAFWDLNGTTAGAGDVSPSGTWDGSVLNWNSAAEGTNATVAWTSGRLAVFSAGTDATGSYTVTVSGSQTNGGLNFKNGAVTLAAGTLPQLIVNTNAPVSVAAGATAKIAVPLLDDGTARTLTKYGGGMLTLSGTNAATVGSTLTINNGAVSFDSTNSIFGIGRNITNSAGGAAMFTSNFGAGNIPSALLDRIVATSAGAIAVDNYASTAFDFNAAGLTAVTLGAIGNVTYTGTLTPNGTTYRLGGGGGTLTLSTANALTGNKSLTVSGPGTVVLSAANDYSGGTTNRAGGTLVVGASGALGSGAVTNFSTAGSSATLRIGSASAFSSGLIALGPYSTLSSDSAAARTVSSPIYISGTCVLGDVANTGKLTFNNSTITLPVANLTLTANSDVEFAAPVGGAGSLNKSGPGTLSYSAPNTFSSAYNALVRGTIYINAGAGGAITNALRLDGTSTFNYDNTTASGPVSQTMGRLYFSASSGVEGTVISTRTTAQPMSLTFASLPTTHTAGASLNFVVIGGVNGTTDNKIAFTTTPTAGSGALLDWGFFFGGSSYAAYDSGGFVRAYTSSDASAVACPAGATLGTVSGTQNGFVTGGDITDQTTASINTINLTNNSLTLSGSAVLSVSGILSSGSSSAQIGGTSGKLQPVTGGTDIVIRVDGPSDQLTIAAGIQNSNATTTATAVTKSGAGALILTGSSSFTGLLKVNAGALLVNGSTAAGSTTYVQAGAILGGSGTIAGPVSLLPGAIIQPSISGDVNTLTLSNPQAPTFPTATVPTANYYATLKIRASGTALDKVVFSAAGFPASALTLGSLDLHIDCANVSGNVSGATILSTGTGFFSPMSFHSVTLDNNSGGYTATVHYNATTVTVDLAPACTPATVNAGPGQMVPANTTSILLAGMVGGGASGGLWSSTNATGSFDNATHLNAVYTPSAADVALRRVTLTLTTTGAGQCAAVSTNMTVTFNSPPVGSDITAGAILGSPVTVPIIGGQPAPTDANGDPLVVSAVQSGLTSGIATTDGANITYTATNSAPATNSFTFVISDNWGGSCTNTLTVYVIPESQGFNCISGPTLTNGLLQFAYAGIPTCEYALEQTASLAAPVNWQSVVTNQARSDGKVTFDITPGTTNGAFFFRTRFVGEP